MISLDINLQLNIFQMKITKNLNDITPEYVEKLRLWLLENAEEFFYSSENIAHSESDFRRFPNSITKLRRQQLCFSDQVMLVDRQHKGIHSYCVCRINKSNTITTQIKVIEIEELTYGFWKNGYFLLPTLETIS